MSYGDEDAVYSNDIMVRMGTPSINVQLRSRGL